MSSLKQNSGAKIYISTLPYTSDFQICHIEGKSSLSEPCTLLPPQGINQLKVHYVMVNLIINYGLFNWSLYFHNEIVSELFLRINQTRKPDQIKISMLRSLKKN